MRSSVRFQIIIPIIIAVMSLTAGCGGRPKTASVPAKTDGPVTVNFWHVLSPYTAPGALLQQMVTSFNDAQKEIRVEAVDMESYANLQKELSAAIAAGKPPAIVQSSDSMLISLVGATSVMALDSLVAAAERADYPDGLLQAQTFDGKLYALPFNRSPIVLIYDKTLVPNPPKSWEEFRAIARSLSAGDRSGTAFVPNVNDFGLLFTQANGEWLKNGRAAFQSEAGVRALQQMVEMVREGSAIALPPGELQVNLFNQGRIAMFAGTSANLAFVQPVSGRPWGVAPVYAGPHNDRTGFTGANLSIVSGTRPDQAQAAARFILWLTGSESTLKLATAKTGYMPVRLSAVSSPQWQEFVKANPEFGALGIAMNKVSPQPNHPQWEAVQRLITAAVADALAGKATPKEALEKAAAEADKLLTR